MIANINNIKRYLALVEKAFKEAESCTSCSESCCDVYGNISSKIYEALDEIEQQLTKKSTENFKDELQEKTTQELLYNSIYPEKIKKIFLSSFENQTIEPKSNIHFQNTSIQTDNLELFEQKNSYTIELKEKGAYAFEYFINSTTEKATVTLFIDNKEVDFSRFTSNTLASNIYGKGVFYNNETNSQLQIINISTDTLEIEKGTLDNTVLAYLCITKL